MNQPQSLKKREEPASFPAWPHFDEEEIAAVSAVLRSGRVNRWTGQENILFEQEFAVFAGCRHAIAVANGTVALELALFALGIGPGDEVIVSSRTFIASASAVVMRGATPVIADIDPDSQNLSAATVQPLLTPRTRAIIAVHLAGWPCDMDPLLELARTHNIKVIEDCAQAQGASYKGCPVGSLGDVAAFSFCQDKIMTTGGEGGMLTTNDPQIWQRAWAYKDHGKDYDTVFSGESGGAFRWLHHSFGTNWRMTEMQAAIGRIALRKVPGWIVRRQRYGAILTETFRKIRGLRVTVPPTKITHAYYKYYTFIEPELLPDFMTRDAIITAISDAGIPCFSGSCSEIYREKAFVTAGLSPCHRLPMARRLGETSLMFLVHPTLTEEHIRQTSKVVQAVMSG